MRRSLLARLAAVPVAPLILVAGAVAGAASPAAAAGPATVYSVAFSNSSGLPADADALVAAAGGSITVRLGDRRRGCHVQQPGLRRSAGP